MIDSDPSRPPPAAMTKQEAQDLAARIAAARALTTRERAIGALDAYHQAHVAFRAFGRSTRASLRTAPEERDNLATALDRARTNLLESGAASWVEDL